MQIAMGVGVKMYLVYIERILKQLLYFDDITPRHVGYHSLSIKVAQECAQYAPTTYLHEAEV